MSLTYQVEVSCKVHGEIVGTYEVHPGDLLTASYSPDGTGDPVDHCHLCEVEREEEVTCVL